MTSLSRGTVPPKPTKPEGDEPTVIDVKILGKDYQVTCPADEQDDLVLGRHTA